MSKDPEVDIQEAEETLRKAMLASDVEVLDRIIAPDLIFTNHLGKQMTKQDDLDAHRSGQIAIETVDLSDQTIKLLENVAIVTVAAHIVGKFADDTFDETLRFTRVWQATSPGNWQIIAAHASAVVEQPQT
ncbi:nuclear transport factor 2 family protein [Oscillatoria sp. CS-180]|uniref:nuclear transport factor 2 family protein n=1 Tax=Oscillatoria sp. CS-180 TaxID=3021720 RepID=UPI00232FC9C0|nr:nuclear transport factor 2 family protein [Oscillatoria sp. CS-180]MDB9528035.1 nuclear transport factor 2 family protein [Oscillatoria sp. CS-180]